MNIVTWLIPIWILIATFVSFWGAAKYITSLFEKSGARKRSGMFLMIWGIVALIAALAFWGFSGPPEAINNPPTKPEGMAARINGIVVPPEPPADLNNATLAGIDVNENGVRDDVERLIAREFGANRENYDKVLSFSIAEQAVIVSPSPETIAAYTRAVDCSTMSAKDLNKATYALLNTPQRRNAYATANAGTTGGECNDTTP